MPSHSPALTLLPPRATTGIGSLPHTQMELALQMALQMDIPFLPQLPVGNPAEFMIPAALDGLPGLSFDSEGVARVDFEAWQERAEPFGRRLEAALAPGGDVSAFEPQPLASRAWQPFLWEVRDRKLAFAKVQLAGPCTVRWSTLTSRGGTAADDPGLDRQILRLLLAKTLALVRAVKAGGTTPLLFLDEPGLYALDVRDVRHLVALQELKLLAVGARREGALVGLHCCGNTAWGALLGLGFDVLSLDVRLSLDAVLEEREALEAFLAGGGTLCLGIVPTDLDAVPEVGDLAAAVETSLDAAFGAERARRLLDRVLLTPACGLAMRSVIDAERIFEQLRFAQAAF